MTTSEWKVFRRFNVIDAGCLMVLVLSAVGMIFARAGYAGVDKSIQGVTKVAIDIYFSGIKTKDTELFKVGERAHLTIRNQPINPPMVITAVKHWPKQIAFLGADGKKAVAMVDPSQPLAHDFLVTVGDEAELTTDGYVVRGNKLKIGNQAELESFKYRVQGVVVDINSCK